MRKLFLSGNTLYLKLEFPEMSNISTNIIFYITILSKDSNVPPPILIAKINKITNDFFIYVGGERNECWKKISDINDPLKVKVNQDYPKYWWTLTLADLFEIQKIVSDSNSKGTL